MRSTLTLATLLWVAVLLLTNTGFCLSNDPCDTNTNKATRRAHISWESLFKELKKHSRLEKSHVIIDGGFYADSRPEEPLKSIVISDCEVDGPLAITGNFLDISFGRCTFKGPVSLYDVSVRNDVTFDSSCFENKVGVRRLGAEKLYLFHSKFISEAHLYTSHELQKIAVEWSEFDSRFRVDGAGELFFNNSTGKTLELSSSVLSQISIDSSKVDSILCDHCTASRFFGIFNSDIRRSLTIQGETFGSAYFDWDGLSQRLHWQTPEDLAELEGAFQRSGAKNLAQAVSYFAVKEKYRYRPAYVRWWDFIFFDLSCGFGAKPLRTLPYAFGWIAIFGFLYSHPRALISKDRDKKKFYEITFFRRLIYGIQFSIACFFRSSFSEWEPSKDTIRIKVFRRKRELTIAPPQIFRIFAIAEAVLSWFLLALFTATYIRATFT